MWTEDQSDPFGVAATGPSRSSPATSQPRRKSRMCRAIQSRAVSTSPARSASYTFVCASSSRRPGPILRMTVPYAGKSSSPSGSLEIRSAWLPAACATRSWNSTSASASAPGSARHAAVRSRFASIASRISGRRVRSRQRRRHRLERHVELPELAIRDAVQHDRLVHRVADHARRRRRHDHAPARAPLDEARVLESRAAPRARSAASHRAGPRGPSPTGAGRRAPETPSRIFCRTDSSTTR